ncbi:hypothetical protein RJT34_08326 [Clitoria ternatea]|uniref:DDE Tnp4 domain-containing protein n=1 Tax=Clitoria ternatea TaxID=43366 RepID=A0AAN9K6E6_CLITE
MKLPATFADPESLSYLYTLLQTSFHQMNDSTTTTTTAAAAAATATARKRCRKNQDRDVDNDDDDYDDVSTTNNNQQEQGNNNNSKSKNKKKNKKEELKAEKEGQVQVQGSGVEGVKSGVWGPQRRLWVKDRSGAWWDECNKEGFPKEEFRKAFRMGKLTFDMICEQLNSTIVKEGTTLRNAIPVRQRVAVCLWRLATGDPLRIVSKRFSLGISTCHKLVLEVCTAIKTVLMPKYLQWPDEVALRGVKGAFEAVSGIPNVVGSMYTSHVPIIAPKISVAAYFNKRHTERNLKTSYSITVQGVVDHRGVFTDVCIGWPGSMPDDQVLEKSALFQRANNGGLLKGHAFNEKIGEVQKVTKDEFARLKGRWSCLQKRTEVKLQDLPIVLGACCVLHNICELKGQKIGPKLKIDLVDDEMVREVALSPINSMKARDTIAHDLLHHGLAGTSFL